MISKIKEAVQQNAEKVAYIYRENTITYKELWAKSCKLKEYLENDISPIIIHGENTINAVVAILASILSNRVYIPLDANTPKERLLNIVNITNSNLILSDINSKINVINLKNVHKQKLSARINNKNIYLIFTSGSTGIPKGVVISKNNLENFLNWLNNTLFLCENDLVILNQANFSFDLSVAGLYYSLCNGHTLISIDDLSNVFNIIKKYKVNLAFLTPTFIKYCLLNKEFNENNYPSLKFLFFCGEKLEVKTVKKIYEAFPRIKIINAYGPTEATCAVSSVLIKEEMLKEKILPMGELGKFACDIVIENKEIIIKGKSVSEGYLNKYDGGFYKENNINCYKTGDYGYIKNGYLYPLGRKDRQVKYKGYRIELDEIEYHLRNMLGVDECAVIAKYSDNKNVKTLKAYVEGNIDLEFLKNDLKKVLPEYMIPKIIKKIDKIPINKNGKLDRGALEKL